MRGSVELAPVALLVVPLEDVELGVALAAAPPAVLDELGALVPDEVLLDCELPEEDCEDPLWPGASGSVYC